MKKAATRPAAKNSGLDDFKQEVINEAGHLCRNVRNDLHEEIQYNNRRIEKLEDKNFQQEAGKLSMLDWCMIGTYAIIAIAVVVITFRQLKQYH